MFYHLMYLKISIFFNLTTLLVMRKKKKNKKSYDYSGPPKPVVIQELRKICPLNEYRVIRPDELKPLKLLSDALLDKMDSVLLACSGSSEDRACYMLNGNRVDFKDSAIDQMPFAFFCSGSTPLTSGSLTQHGDWSNRSDKTPPLEFWEQISSSGIGQCFPLQEMPTSPSGSIIDLKIKSQLDAFEDSVSHLKKIFGV